MPDGKLNLAAEPVPSVLPEEPAVPARVVTTPALVILRIVWLLVSTTNTFPAVSAVTSKG